MYMSKHYLVAKNIIVYLDFFFFYPLPDIQEFYEVTIREKQNESTEPIKPAEHCPPAKNVTSETRTSKVSMEKMFLFILAEIAVHVHTDYSRVH